MTQETVTVSKKELLDLVYYCDTCAGILRENGYPGKAEALEKRYRIFGKALDIHEINKQYE